MANDINVKALAKLGKTLAGISDAIELLDSKESLSALLDTEIAKRQALIATLDQDVAKEQAALKDAKDAAKKVIADAKAVADSVRIKADLDSQEVIAKATASLNAATEQVKAAAQRIEDIKLEEAAASEKVAALAKTEADILSRIADHKAKLLKALE